MRQPKILFCSYQSYLDPSSGAAQSVRDLFVLLSRLGWQCQVFCGSRLDFEDARTLPQLLQEQQIPFVERPGLGGALPWSVLHFRQGEIPVLAYQAPRTGPEPTRPEGSPFLEVLERVLDWARPDLVLTYGGNWLTRAAISAVKRREIPVVFFLRNLAYAEADLFWEVDGVLVPSRFSQAHYQRLLGLKSTALPSPLDWSRCHCPQVQGKYVTFVNPQPDKGLFWLLGLARELERRRPEIPLLVVEGRGGAARLKEAGLDPALLPNIHFMANTPDPRNFYGVSRVVLMPSLWLETWGRVAGEAFLNGIPVLASNRGGLPEVLAEAGFSLDIPQRFTPATRDLPTPEETAPWVETILRLWDDEAFYQAEGRRCLQAAEAWRPERLGPRYDDFLKAVLNAAPAAARARAMPPPEASPVELTAFLAGIPEPAAASGSAHPPIGRELPPTLCFVTTCMGRLKSLQQTLGPAVAQPGCAHVVVDFSCPEHTGDWVAANYPQVVVVREPGREKYHSCRARNLGARAAAAPWLCFCDADVLLEPSFAATVLPLLRPGYFYRPDSLADLGLYGTFICARADFERIGGFDEVYQGWGDADVDIYSALEMLGVRPATFSVALLRHLTHDDAQRVRFYDNKDRWLNCSINRLYRVIKFNLLRLGARHLTFDKRERLYRMVTDTVTKSMRAGKGLSMEVNIGPGENMPRKWQLDCSLTYRLKKP